MTATEQILPRNTPDHTIDLVELGPTSWRAVCSCEKYRSTGYSSPGRAKEAGDQRLRAKGVMVG